MIREYNITRPRYNRPVLASRGRKEYERDTYMQQSLKPNEPVELILSVPFPYDLREADGIGLPPRLVHQRIVVFGGNVAQTGLEKVHDGVFRDAPVVQCTGFAADCAAV